VISYQVTSRLRGGHAGDARRDEPGAHQSVEDRRLAAEHDQRVAGRADRAARQNVEDSDRIALAASGMMEVFKKMWPEAWGVRMEHILRNVLMALLERPDATLRHVL
jgi:hypothetical protein